MNFAGPNRRGGKPKKYQLTKRAEALIRERYKPLRRDTGRREIAAELGVPPWVVTIWAGQLGVRRVKEPFWTDAQIEYLRSHVGKIAFRRIAKKLGRSIESVKLKAKRIGIQVSRMDASNASDLAVLLGVDRHRIIHWIERGWIEATRDVQGGVLRFTDAAVRSFLRDHGYSLDLSRVEPAWLMRMAFGESEWRGDPRSCRYCDAVFYSRLETRVETVCAGCAAREASRRRAA